MDTPPIPTPAEIAKKSALGLAEAEKKVRNAVAHVDAAIVFSCYSLSRLVAMHNERAGKHTRPAPAAVELAAWLLYPEFGRSTARDGEHIQNTITALEEHESAFTFAEMFPELPEDEQHDDLAMHLRIHSGMVRGSGYPIQVIRRIEGVFKTLESAMSAKVGISPGRACEIIKAITLQMEDNVNGMRANFFRTSARGDALAARGNALSEAEKLKLKEIGQELQRILDGMERDWVPTRTQIAARLNGVSESEWTALTATIGLTPASRATLTKVVDVQDRPLFFLDTDRAFCLHGVGCFDAVFTYFDDVARSDATLRDRYGSSIAAWMESEIEKQMQRLFPAANVMRSACFTDPDNPGGETEADIVVVWGPFLIVAEAKGKRIAKDALRGSLVKLRQTIAANIQDAFVQSRRVVRVLERDGKIIFKEKSTGRIVEVEQNQLRRVMPISITLQNLSGIPTQLAVTQRLGLFKGNAFPWSVCIDDLDTITQFASTPDVFLHYIERRTAHQNIKVGLHGDELDIFGQYLATRLHPSQYEGRKEIADHTGKTFISFDGGDEDFEPFYTALWNGEPPPSTTIDLKVPPEIRAVLSELRSRTDDGARWIAFALLGLSHAALERLARALKDLKNAATSGSRILRILFQEDDIVINVMAHCGLTEDNFFKNVTLRTRIEHYRAKPRATITLGINQLDSIKAFEVAQWMEGPWEYEEIMEKLLAEDREKPQTIQLQHRAKKIGRNDPCPCGSGKKFKRCCIDRIKFTRES